MKRKDCIKWAVALSHEGVGKFKDLPKFKQLKGKMSDSVAHKKPTSCCCLGVANEVFKPQGFTWDRAGALADCLAVTGVLRWINPNIFGVSASKLNDCLMNHKEIATLLLLAVETGEYKNI